MVFREMPEADGRFFQMSSSLVICEED